MNGLTAYELARLPRSETDAFLASLSDDEARWLFHHWPFHARAEQLPPPGDWLIWLILSGRGWGKTRTGAEYVIERARKGHGPIALIGETAADVRDVMIEEGPASIMEVSPPNFRPKYEPSKRRLTWPNGVVGTSFSGDDPDQLRGPQHATVWADEPAKWRYATDAWDNMEMGLRVGTDPRCIATTTPRPIPLIKRLIADKNVHVTRGSTYDNIDNLSPIFIERITERYEGTRLGRQELHAELLEDVEGALWKRAWLEEARRVKMPDMKRIVVGVDPPGETAECGIIVAGLGIDGEGYLIEDASLAGSPDQWAKAVVGAYHKHAADKIVPEKNQGGAMVEHTLRTVRDESDKAIGRNLPIAPVWASRGKATRAEPVAALSEQGRIHHAGYFAALEDQLCEWIPGAKSPDRLDAYVWAFTELMVDTPRHSGFHF